MATDESPGVVTLSVVRIGQQRPVDGAQGPIVFPVQELSPPQRPVPQRIPSVVAYRLLGQRQGRVDLEIEAHQRIDDWLFVIPCKYGDISPQTALGQTVASIVMILGFAIIAVPTGIVVTEMSRAARSAEVSTQACLLCASEGHDHVAKFCKDCGAPR